jgi:hypothetical protein
MLLSVTVLTTAGQAIQAVHQAAIPITTGTQTITTRQITIPTHGTTIAAIHGTQAIPGIPEAPMTTAGQAVMITQAAMTGPAVLIHRAAETGPAVLIRQAAEMLPAAVNGKKLDHLSAYEMVLNKVII